MIKIITGRIGNRIIEETIEQYQSSIGEQVRTAKRNIIRRFESFGYTEKDVKFEE